jgi:preprotein translocase subunit SecD
LFVEEGDNLSQKIRTVISLFDKGLGAYENYQKRQVEKDIKSEANLAKIKEAEINKSANIIETLLNEDAEFAKALVGFEEKEISALVAIIKDETLPEELRKNAGEQLIRMASSTNKSKEDFNERKNNKNNTVLIGVLIGGTCYIVPVLINSYEKLKNMKTFSYKIGRTTKNIF